MTTEREMAEKGKVVVLVLVDGEAVSGEEKERMRARARAKVCMFVCSFVRNLKVINTKEYICKSILFYNYTL